MLVLPAHFTDVQSTLIVAFPVAGSDLIRPLAEISEGPASGLQPLYYLVAALGAVIAILGIRIALHGAPSAGVSASGPTGLGVTFSGVTQGVVIAIIGAVILVGSLYFSQQSITTTTTTTTTQNQDGSSTIEEVSAD